jgi:hypothetical protein
MGTVDMGADEFIGTHRLEADAFTLSAGTGGTIHFTLNGGLTNAGRNYLLLGSTQGTVPGIRLPGGYATLPLNWGPLTDFILLHLNTALFSGFLGELNASGSAPAQLNMPPLPGAAGIAMHYAFCLNNPFDFVSHPVEIEIVP